MEPQDLTAALNDWSQSQPCPMGTFVIVETFWLGLARGLTPSEKRPGILPDLQSMDSPQAASDSMLVTVARV